MHTHCPCPNTGCSRFGNCRTCREFHERVGSPVYCDKTQVDFRPNTSGVNLMDYAACAG